MKLDRCPPSPLVHVTFCYLRHYSKNRIESYQLWNARYPQLFDQRKGHTDEVTEKVELRPTTRSRKIRCPSFLPATTVTTATPAQKRKHATVMFTAWQVSYTNLLPCATSPSANPASANSRQLLPRNFVALRLAGYTRRLRIFRYAGDSARRSRLCAESARHSATNTKRAKA